MDNLELRRNGKLFHITKEGERDVTDLALFYLMDNCVLGEDVTLRDVFLLLKQDIDTYKVIINGHVEKIVEEGLSGKKSEPIEGDCNIDFLELYWNLEINEGKWPSFGGCQFPQFHAWGDWPNDEFGNHPPGTKGGIAVDFTPSYDLLDYPLKLRGDVNVCITEDYKWKTAVNLNLPSPSYSLLNILYGVIWELGWHGSPEQRVEKSEELESTVKGIKDGTIKTVPIEVPLDDEEE